MELSLNQPEKIILASSDWSFLFLFLEWTILVHDQSPPFNRWMDFLISTAMIKSEYKFVYLTTLINF